MAEKNNKKYKPPVLKRIGGILLLAVGLVFLGVTLFYAVKDLPLWVFGKHTKAEVTEIWYERADEVKEREEGMQNYNFYVSYQFATPNGKVVNGTSKTSSLEWSGMWEGLNIDIVYFPLYPELNRIDDSNWALFLSCTYLPLIAISIVGLRVGWYLLTTP